MTFEGKDDLRGLSVTEKDGDTLVQRLFPAPTRAFRTAFQRDRDRIVQARAFRRLAGKPRGSCA